MTREIPYPRWMTRVRRQAVGYAIMGIVAMAVVAGVTGALARNPIFVRIAGAVETWTPWIVLAACVWSMGWIAWLASTYLLPDRWLLRWARAQGYAVD